MNNANVSSKAPGEGQQDFAVDIDNFQALNGNTNLSQGDKNSPSPQQPMKQGTEEFKHNVANVEDDGNGFFITGINTHERQPEDKEEEPQR